MAVLDAIHLRHFRNYSELDLSFNPGVNLFIGDNGQGKTNILESIYFLSLLRSFRTSQTQNLVAHQQGTFIVRGELVGGDAQNIAVSQGGGTRTLRIDGENVSRASQFISRLPCIPFVPEDIDLIKGSAGGRRQFLDVVLCQQDKQYLHALQDYSKALRSRNSLLKQDSANPAALAAFDQVLIDRGARVCMTRRDFCDDLARRAATLGGSLYADDAAVLQIAYDASLGDVSGAEIGGIRDIYAAALERSRQVDAQRRHTQVGPHRDDLSIWLNGRALSKYGSEGQCRVAALALRTAGAELLAERHDDVVLLIDDVIGELDAARREAFCSVIEQFPQVFIACTDTAGLTALKPTASFSVAAGAVTAR
jgi:DNA replication and repair protein RecF